MATPQSPDAMAAMVEQIAAKQLGPTPAAPQAAPAAPAPQAAPQPAPTESAEGTAAAKGSPETEGDKMDAPAVIYEVDFGPNDKRKLTPEQIAATFQRYSALNFKNAALKPVMDVVESIMRDNPNMASNELAEKMAAIYRAQQSNPQMGNIENKTAQSPGLRQGGDQDDADDFDTQLRKWEEENAASLPPGYKDVAMGTKQQMMQMQQQLQQTQQMLAAVLAQTQGVADAAKMGVDQSKNTQINAIRQTIANNVDRAQAALQLPDQAANDFMMFAGERGFTIEDFVDPQLTFRVMSDFRNAMNSPEMDRLRNIAQRRQAYTGSLGSTPSAGPEAAQPAGADRLSSLTNSIMASRGMG